MGSVDNIMLPQDTDTNILTVNTTLTVLEDQRYTAVVSFSNLAGDFNTTSEMSFSKLKMCIRFNINTDFSAYIQYSNIALNRLSYFFE